MARLHLRLDLDEVADEIGLPDGYRVRYHLHPPTLRRLGVDHKIAIGGGMGKLAFRGLAALRHVRGTPLDVFGYARHRREERALADEYEGLVGAATSRLSPPTYAAAVDLARSVAEIRGYEDIKSAAIERWRAEHGRAACRGHGRVSGDRSRSCGSSPASPSTAEILRRGWADALAADAEHADAAGSAGRGPAGRCG